MSRLLLYRYPGGKSRITNWILGHLPESDRYTEVIGGACSVLLARDPARSETIVERNPDQVIVLRTIRDHPREFRRRLWHVRWSEGTWIEAKDRLREGDWDSDLEWAALSYTRPKTSVIYGRPGSGAQEKLENPPRSRKNAGGNRPTFFQAPEGFE